MKNGKEKHKLHETEDVAKLDPADGEGHKKSGWLDQKLYEKELLRLQFELVKMQYWIKRPSVRGLLSYSRGATQPERAG